MPEPVSRTCKHHKVPHQDQQQPANHLTLSTASTLLLTHIIQQYASVQWALPKVTGGLSPYTLRNVLLYIEDNLSGSLTLGMLAREAALSEYHFARMFRQSMKIAPHQYVMQRRMERAKQLLTGTQMTLTDVALACGFSSSSHFSNRVKAALGLTASQLREAGRQRPAG